MTRSPLRLLAALALVALTFVVVACGGNDNEWRQQHREDEQRSTTAGKKGGKLEQLGASDVDFLDPGQTYYTVGFQVIYATQTPLYALSPTRTRRAGLADGEPQISDDKKSVTVKLKKGVKFGPPVNREIQAKDVKYAFERAATTNVPNQYTTYFNFIEGYPKKPGASRTSPASSSTTRPDHVQARPGAGPGLRRVPDHAGDDAGAEGVRREVRQAEPVDVQRARRLVRPVHGRERRQGQLTGYKAGKSIHLVRNPNWDKTLDFRPAYLDEIKLTTNATDANVAGRQVLAGQNLILDTNPPAQVLKRVVQRQKDQLVTLPGGGFRWFPLNATIKPLDNINVRKAILAAFDRDAAIKARGGTFVGIPGTHFIPPGISGFDEAGGKKGPGFDFLANPKGDMAVAEKYMKEAGYSSGKYDGSDELLMVTANVDPGKAQAEVAKAQLEKLGFKVRLRTVPQDAVYTRVVPAAGQEGRRLRHRGLVQGLQRPPVDARADVQGLEHLAGRWQQQPGQLNDPKIDKAMDDAALLEGEERYQAWGEIDKMITAQAPAVPFIWDNTNLIHVEERERGRQRVHELVRLRVQLDQVRGTGEPLTTTAGLAPAGPAES